MKSLQSLFICLMLAVVFFAGGCGASPQDTLFEFKKAVNEQDWNKAWPLLSAADKTFFEDMYNQVKNESEKNPDVLKQFNISPDEFKGMNSQSFFVKMMSMSQTNAKTASTNVKMEVESTVNLKNKVIISLVGDPRKYTLVQEYGVWKVSLNDMRDKK